MVTEKIHVPSEQFYGIVSQPCIFFSSICIDQQQTGTFGPIISVRCDVIYLFYNLLPRM